MRCNGAGLAGFHRWKVNSPGPLIAAVHRQSERVTRFWIIIIVVAFVIASFSFVGAASIVNARLLAESAVPSRYKQLITESDATGHIHDVHVQHRFVFGEINGFSDDHSYVQVAALRVPISNDEWFGWMLIAMGMVTITVWVLLLVRYRKALSGG
ncbi:hypothetical protein [Stieleria varia]|uniref:Uncharacterized protein n=1 Tax=Stieleria varia TaxID=2528005 RepID=A0A5C5ZI07_9BACT|nr:hypothetical protein [Stieleria varia]TWT87049.1 hypothetical protein Pla52n_70220 [Stieleria varia]